MANNVGSATISIVAQDNTKNGLKDVENKMVEGSKKATQKATQSAKNVAKKGGKESGDAFAQSYRDAAIAGFKDSFGKSIEQKLRDRWRTILDLSFLTNHNVLGAANIGLQIGSRIAEGINKGIRNKVTPGALLNAERMLPAATSKKELKSALRAYSQQGLANLVSIGASQDEISKFKDTIKDMKIQIKNLPKKGFATGELFDRWNLWKIRQSQDGGSNVLGKVFTREQINALNAGVELKDASRRFGRLSANRYLTQQPDGSYTPTAKGSKVLLKHGFTSFGDFNRAFRDTVANASTFNNIGYAELTKIPQKILRALDFANLSKNNKLISESKAKGVPLDEKLLLPTDYAKRGRYAKVTDFSRKAVAIGAPTTILAAISGTIGVAVKAFSFAISQFSDSVKQFSDTERSVNQVSGILGGASKTKLMSAIANAAENSPLTTTGFGVIAEQMARSGKSEQDIINELQTYGRFAVASGMDPSSAVEMLNDIQRSYGFSSGEMVGVADKLIATVNGTSMTFDNLRESFAAGALSASRLADVSLDTLLKDVGALADRGIKGSRAGTTIKNVRLRESVNDNAKAAYEANGITDEMLSNTEFLGNLFTYINQKQIERGISQAQRIDELQSMTGMYGIPATLLSGVSEERYNNILKRAPGATQRFTNEKMSGVSGAWDLAMSKIQAKKTEMASELFSGQLETLAQDVARNRLPVVLDDVAGALEGFAEKVLKSEEGEPSVADKAYGAKKLASDIWGAITSGLDTITGHIVSEAYNEISDTVGNYGKWEIDAEVRKNQNIAYKNVSESLIAAEKRLSEALELESTTVEESKKRQAEISAAYQAFTDARAKLESLKADLYADIEANGINKSVMSTDGNLGNFNILMSLNRQLEETAGILDKTNQIEYELNNEKERELKLQEEENERIRHDAEEAAWNNFFVKDVGALRDALKDREEKDREWAKMLKMGPEDMWLSDVAKVAREEKNNPYAERYRKDQSWRQSTAQQKYIDTGVSINRDENGNIRLNPDGSIYTGLTEQELGVNERKGEAKLFDWLAENAEAAASADRMADLTETETELSQDQVDELVDVNGNLRKIIELQSSPQSVAQYEKDIEKAKEKKEKRKQDDFDKERRQWERERNKQEREWAKSEQEKDQRHKEELRDIERKYAKQLAEERSKNDKNLAGSLGPLSDLFEKTHDTDNMKPKDIAPSEWFGNNTPTDLNNGPNAGNWSPNQNASRRNLPLNLLGGQNQANAYDRNNQWSPLQLVRGISFNTPTTDELLGNLGKYGTANPKIIAAMKQQEEQQKVMEAKMKEAQENEEKEQRWLDFLGAVMRGGITVELSVENWFAEKEIAFVVGEMAIENFKVDGEVQLMLDRFDGGIQINGVDEINMGQDDLKQGIDDLNATLGEFKTSAETFFDEQLKPVSV